MSASLKSQSVATPVFSEKLARLHETIGLVSERSISDVAEAIRDGRNRTAAAIGSGGSMVTAEFFASCRASLGLGLTHVMTPMEFVMRSSDWTDVDVWLFSAGANNPDVAAAFRRAVASRCRSIRLMTVRSDGATAVAAAECGRAEVFVLPVADPKDGFLATHSMMAMISGLLFASDALVERPRGRGLVDEFVGCSRLELLRRADDVVGGFRAGDTLVTLNDPRVAAVGVLLETSLWETGIAPCQRTDFRNFAHGRHVWAARHPNSMFILALTTRESEAVWHPISDALPERVRRGEVCLGHGGRLATALGIVQGLSMIARLGEIAGVDPGRPGHGPYAKAIYEDVALESLVDDLGAAIRHKAAAQLLHDSVRDAGMSVCVMGKRRLRALSGASFVGLALDYDGTVVPSQPTEARLGPPQKEFVLEIVRLIECDIQVGFATGRGGSAGEKIREVLPERLHRHVTMGYYNGAHIRGLDIDIRLDGPAPHGPVSRAADWIAGSGLLRSAVRMGASKVQVTLLHEDVIDVGRFATMAASCPEIADGSVRVLSSHHSFDLVPAGTSKLRLVRALAERSGSPDGLVLGVGDSGSPLGNDHELLSGPYGLSVDSVCGDPGGAWTLFGSSLQGPEALVRILRAVMPCDARFHLDVSALSERP